MARLLTLFPIVDRQTLVAFANTGEEDERTLQFVDRCDREWNLGVIWVEAVVNPEHGKGTTHRVVTFETATRGPSIFESMIDKFGISNKNYPHCTRELKLKPLTSYLRSIGWNAGTYDTAIGIRADEIDRMSASAKEQRIVYPLIKMGITKADVFAFWDQQPFDLELPEHRGNCVWCWKKSLRKHLTLARETPEIFDFAHRMETTKAHCGAGEGDRVFFRGPRSAAELIELSKGDFERFVDSRYLDQAGGCSESCEVFGDYQHVDFSALWQAIARERETRTKWAQLETRLREAATA